ncbi:hypothetical protein CFP56_015935 [Quercus suber]|uniref:Uncharacterized protein n=1 Tax=Quercus suber TaxID=58331 RepID=A0AAW0M319_QUESU
MLDAASPIGGSRNATALTFSCAFRSGPMYPLS